MAFINKKNLQVHSFWQKFGQYFAAYNPNNYLKESLNIYNKVNTPAFASKDLDYNANLGHSENVVVSS